MKIESLTERNKFLNGVSDEKLQLQMQLQMLAQGEQSATRSIQAAPAMANSSTVKLLNQLELKDVQPLQENLNPEDDDADDIGHQNMSGISAGLSLQQSQVVQPQYGY